MADYVNTNPNLQSPHTFGPPTMADLVFDYFAKQQYTGITPLAVPEEEEEPQEAPKE